MPDGCPAMPQRDFGCMQRINDGCGARPSAAFAWLQLSLRSRQSPGNSLMKVSRRSEPSSSRQQPHHIPHHQGPCCPPVATCFSVPCPITSCCKSSPCAPNYRPRCGQHEVRRLLSCSEAHAAGAAKRLSCCGESANRNGSCAIQWGSCRARPCCCRGSYLQGWYCVMVASPSSFIGGPCCHSNCLK